MASITDIINDKSIRAKQKTELLFNEITENRIAVSDLLNYAQTAKDTGKATCIEALEMAAGKNPVIVDKTTFRFLIQCLSEQAPRVKWESAKVIGHTAHLHAGILDDAIAGLLQNTEHPGTVVRWSAAFALGEILKLKTKHNKELLPAIEAICNTEEQNSIKKIYLAAVKAVSIG